MRVAPLLLLSILLLICQQASSTGKAINQYETVGDQTGQEEEWNRLRAEANEASKEERKEPPRIALMFLTRGAMPLDFLWERFISQAPDRVSVYLHAAPGFEYNSSTTAAPSFYGRQVSSVPVDWGEMNVVDAERRLIATALADRRNERFILLSESCIPLRNLKYVYNYLLSDPKSFVDSHWDPFNRFHPHMAPLIKKSNWRKGAQWLAITRRHALVVVNDNWYYGSFRRYCSVSCKMGPPCGRFCAADEHYIQTLLAMLGMETEINPRPVTFMNWRQGGGHPKLYSNPNVSFIRYLIDKLQSRVRDWRVAEKQLIDCGVDSSGNGSDSDRRKCWLFARKFDAQSGKAVDGLAEDLMNLPTLKPTN